MKRLPLYLIAIVAIVVVGLLFTRSNESVAHEGVVTTNVAHDTSPAANGKTGLSNKNMPARRLELPAVHPQGPASCRHAGWLR